MGKKKETEATPTTEDKVLQDARIVYDAVMGKTQITKSSELYRFMHALTGELVPHTPVCAHHKTPWHMIWESYKVDLPEYSKMPPQDIIAVGPREGYKTLSTAKLIAMESLLKPKVTISSMAAVIKQAARCYRYASQYLFHPLLTDMNMVVKNIMEETRLANSSVYEQLVATVSGVNSPHPNKLRADEVELMKPEVVEEMKNMPSSYNGWKAHTLYTSTRKYFDGLMSELIAQAAKKGYSTKTIIWCYKDVSEPCPDERSGVNPHTFEVEDIFHHGEKVIVNAYEYCGDCPILPSCKGDLKRAKGMIPIDDSIKKWNELDRDTWLAQKECVEPPRTALFYYDWDEKFNVPKEGVPYNPAYPVEMFCDFTGGGEDPSVFQFWQKYDSNDYLIMELVYRRRSTGDVGREVERICREKGIRPMRMMGDSSQMQQIRDLQATTSFFRSLRPVRKIDRKEGLGICKRRIKDNNGVRHTFVDEKCHNFKQEIRELKRKASDVDDHKDGNDHSMDAWRYYCVANYYTVGEPRIRVLGSSGDDYDTIGEAFAAPKPVNTVRDGRGVQGAIDDYLRESD
jgi:hypothetical protein